MKKLLSIVLPAILLLVSCAKQSSQTEVVNSDTCTVSIIDTEVPQYQYVEAVDLGLSVLWADRNLGATEPADCGGYYPSLKAQDTIKALLGDEWRLPTVKEMEELFHRCQYGFTCYMIDKNGIRVRGKQYSYKKGSCIFMPSAGYMSENVNMQYSTLGLYTTSTHTFEGQYNKSMWGGYWDDEEEVGMIPWHEITSLGEGPVCRYSIRPVKDK